MSHPITGSKRSILIYSLVWFLVAATQGVLYFYVFDFPMPVVITDAVFSSFLFGFMGLLAWYPTRYIPFQRQSPLYSIVAHVVAGLVVMGTWVLITVAILNAFFSQQESYIEFLNQTIAWRAMLGGLIYLVLVLIYYLVSNSQKLQERAQQEVRLKGLVRDAELNMLKSQINPHFLFNSLNSISSLTMSNPEEAREMIIRLSDFLRYSLKHRENEYVPLKEELGRMKDYLAIERIRFGEKLRYESCVPEEENMKMLISNDYDPSVPSRKGTGVGLQNVRQRIDLAYKEKGSVQWSGKDGIFTVTILFPRIFI
jgi:sensor histidine kinase YesM